MLSSLLPSIQYGFLPFFLSCTAVQDLLNSTVAYVAPIESLEQFSGPQAPDKSPLLAHIYGMKIVYTGLIQIYAAYHITNKGTYDLAIATLIGTVILYISECFVWKTVGVRQAVFRSVMAGLGLIWMIMERDAYTGVQVT
ncbi:hypothetical protein BJX99DRAFT_219623 [Aspergillus californicus]